jgi:hypothetical protein
MQLLRIDRFGASLGRAPRGTTVDQRWWWSARTLKSAQLLKTRLLTKNRGIGSILGVFRWLGNKLNID